MFDFIKTAYAAAPAEPAAPAIPVTEITAQVQTAINGLLEVITSILPSLLVIFATIIGLYLILRLVSRVARGR